MENAGNGQQRVFRLAEVVKMTGLTRQTIQYYLMLDLVHETRRSSGGHRLFNEETVKRIKLVHQLNQTGYTLRDIRDIFLKER